MEKARELAALSETENIDRLESSFEFIRLNEFAIRYHLAQLTNSVEDFINAYKNLMELSDLNETELPRGDTIWELVITCAESLAAIANVLSPNPRKKKGDLGKEFTLARGQFLQELLSVKVDERNSLVNFRNRVHHEDEDFDEWYYKRMSNGYSGDSTVIRRKILWAQSPVNSDSMVVASAYDVKVGFVHFFDHRFSLHKFMSWVKKIRKNINDADKRLTEIAGRKTEVSIQ